MTHVENLTMTPLIKDNIHHDNSPEPTPIPLNSRDLLPSQLPHVSPVIDTCHVVLSYTWPESWISSHLVNTALKLFIGHALEQCIQVQLAKIVLHYIVPFTMIKNS